MARKHDRWDRREFLRRSVVTGLGAGLLASAGSAEEREPVGVKRYVPLGKTGLRISDVSMGGADLEDVEIVRRALDRGINYFDTAEIYDDGNGEINMGKGLKGARDRVVLTSKVHAWADSTQQQMMEALEGSLRRLQTDYVDIYFNHAVNDIERLQNPEWGEFVERAKQQGKIRFSGMSGHGSRLVECLDFAFEHDLVDVVLSAYNFAEDPGFYVHLRYSYQQWWAKPDWVAYLPAIPQTLAKGKSKGVGIVCMKTLRGARLNDLRAYEMGRATFAQAALRWVLSNPDVDAAIITMKDGEFLDECLGASGWDGLKYGDLGILRRYEALNGQSQCRYGCSTCSDSCPAGVPIPDVLRTRMYARDYQSPRLARSEYARLGAGASACLSCAHHACANACPFGLGIDELTRDTHELLG